MILSSFEFLLLFLPITLIIYFSLCYFKKYTCANIWLLVASVFYYGYYNWAFSWVIIATTLCNFFFAKAIKKTNSKKILLTLAIIINVAFLAFFKYYYTVTSFFDLNSTISIILPLGISFFTFQQIAFLVDTYRNEVPEYSFIDYALYVAYFPKLLSGPIVTHSELLLQFSDESKKKLNFDNVSKGLFAFGIGLAEKVLIADAFGIIVDYGYSNVATITSFEAILTIIGYTMQVFFDFAGYCNMAIGASLMFNIELPINFNSPYRAKNILDFWKRWHITLTNFLTKYIYFPLGGNRRGTLRTYINVIIIFFISGVWHGAGVTFIIWGLLHGIVSVITRIFKKTKLKLPSAISWILFFCFINISWVFFRAPSIDVIPALFERICSGGFYITAALEESLRQPFLVNIFAQFFSLRYGIIIFTFISLYFATISKNVSQRLDKFKPSILNLIIIVVLFFFGILSISGVQSFLYVNF